MAGSNAPAYLVGAYEHPGRNLPDHTLAQIHAEIALGAVADAGLELSDVDGFATAGDPGGFGAISMADYLGLQCSYIDSTETGGSSYVVHVGHAADAIAAGLCKVVLITLAGKPRTGGSRPGGSQGRMDAPEYAFESVYGPTTVSMYAMAARRHMHEYGTTPEQLAAVKVAASMHAQYNPNAFLRDPLTIEQVLDSPYVAEPLHRMDCCVITDGGGAVIVAAPDVAKSLKRPLVEVLSHAEAPKHTGRGRVDLTYTGAAWTGPAAFERAGLTQSDIDYASIYDSFTITVIETLEDLGFCKKGQGGAFVADGSLLSPNGVLPFNTDGGGLCNNHPANRGGMTKIIEAVRQLRGEAFPQVQVPNCELALVHGTGGSLATRMGSATLLLGAR